MSAATPRSAAPASSTSNGEAIKSCTALAVILRRRAGDDDRGPRARAGKLHPMQQAFQDNHGLQCGFCTPGMIMAVVDLVNRKGSNLDEATIRHEPRGQYLPLHRLPQHREGGAAGRTRNGRRSDVAGRGIVNDTGFRERTHERDRHWRLRQTQGRHPLHHRQGPLRRRHQSSRPGLRLFRALAARACDDQSHRYG